LFTGVPKSKPNPAMLSKKVFPLRVGTLDGRLNFNGWRKLSEYFGIEVPKDKGVLRAALPLVDNARVRAARASSTPKEAEPELKPNENGTDVNFLGARLPKLKAI
jgi:hypothetical protein